MAAGFPSKNEIITAFKDYDGSGLGLLTEKQSLAALRDIENVPFTLNEMKQHISLAKTTSSDPNGKIKLEDLATYIFFEVVKKSQQPQQQQSQQQQSQPQQQQQSSQANNTDNPFDSLFGSFDNSNNNNNNNNQVGIMKNKPALNVTITPDPNAKPKDNNASDEKVDMSGTKSPTRANDNELPEWWGHSLASPGFGNEVNQVVSSPWDVFGFDDNTTNNGKNGQQQQQQQSNNNNNAAQYGSVKTPHSSNIVMAPETPAAHKRHGSHEDIQGLIPKPKPSSRTKSPRSKTRPASPDGQTRNDFLSWDNATDKVNQNQMNKSAGGSYTVPVSPKHDKKKKKSKKHKKHDDKDTPTADDDDENNDNNVDKEKEKAKEKKPKRRPKTDAIAEMKRGTAMLKYGRHGFPHFRRFQLSRDNRRLLWYSRKKGLGETHIEVKEVKDVLEGQQTEVFKQCTQATLKKASFSIIYGARLKTLDVVAKSQEEAQLWTKGLKGLMKANKVGKLHKVVQILVDVPFVDITKPKGKEPTRDPNSKQQYSPDLIQTIDITLKQSKKTFETILKLVDSKNILKSSEYDNISTLVAELEQRLNEVETGLNQKNVDFVELKRDVWVLKVDVTVLEEKLRVLSKGGSEIYL